MTPARYEIAHFQPRHLSGVLDLLAGLWQYDRELRERYFRWRYEENPYAPRALGIVALQDGQPAGFRGYVAGRFTSGSPGGDVGVLYPCDTVVAPEHRNQGLSVAMGERASEYEGEGYRIFLNLTSSRNSRPGYQALGFRPLTKRVLLQRGGRNPLSWALRAWSKRRDVPAPPSARRRLRFGRNGNVLVSESPRPGDMAAVNAAERLDGVMRPHQGPEFFGWRYRNPLRQYAHYFLMDGTSARAYLAVDVSADGRCGSILDYGEAIEGGLHALMHHLCDSGDFRFLSMLALGADSRLAGTLASLDFTPVHTPKTLLRAGSVDELAPSVLFRPVAATPGEQSFRIGAIDLRDPANWRLKPICADGA